jgi:sulfur carrier protein ThiS
MSRLHDAARTVARTTERHTLAAGATLPDLLAALGITAATDLTATRAARQ